MVIAVWRLAAGSCAGFVDVNGFAYQLWCGLFVYMKTAATAAPKPLTRLARRGFRHFMEALTCLH